MSKLFTTNEDVASFIENKFNETGLSEYGVTLKIMSVTKAKEVIKTTKASATTEFIAKKDSMIQVFIYEAAFERLDEEAKNMLAEMSFANIGYDLEKDKIVIDNRPYVSVFSMRKKYGDEFMNKLELSSIVIEEIEEEEKERKLAEKEAKKNKSRNQ